MTTTIKNLVPSKYVESTQTKQFTAATATSIAIDSCVIHNSGSQNAIISINVVLGSDTLGNSNRLVYETIKPNESYLCPELIGVVLSSGDYLSTLSTVASTLVINISGREITT